VRRPACCLMRAFSDAVPHALRTLLSYAVPACRCHGALLVQCLRPEVQARPQSWYGGPTRAGGRPARVAGPEAAHLRHHQRAGGHRPDREEVEEPCAVAAGRGRRRRGRRRRARAAGGGGVADAGGRCPQACVARQIDARQAPVPASVYCDWDAQQADLAPGPVCCDAGMHSNRASAHKRLGWRCTACTPEAVSAVLTAPTEHLVPGRSRALSRLGQLRPGTGKAP
jgi:hypothetical protein